MLHMALLDGNHLSVGHLDDSLSIVRPVEDSGGDHTRRLIGRLVLSNQPTLIVPTELAKGDTAIEFPVGQLDLEDPLARKTTGS